MADITSVDLDRIAGDNLEQASPDLLRAMVKSFAEALMGAGEDRVNYRNGYRDRRWSSVVLVTSDAHAGLVAAIAATLTGVSWQRCRTHYMRDLLTKVSKTSQPWVATLARTIFDQPDPGEVHAQSGRVVAALEAKLPAAAGHLSAARDDLLAFTAVPREIWRQVWSSNPLSVNRLSGDTIMLAA